jgi:hypothetical protein
MQYYYGYPRVIYYIPVTSPAHLVVHPRTPQKFIQVTPPKPVDSRTPQAVLIQKFVRETFLARMAQYRELCKQSEGMERARGGHTPVFLPKGANVVLKRAGADAPQRHKQSNEVRKTLTPLRADM